MIMSIIIAIVGGILLAISYLVCEPYDIMQIITMLGGWGLLIFAGICLLYWIFTSAKDKIEENHSSSSHRRNSTRYNTSSKNYSYENPSSNNLKPPDESLEVSISMSIENHLPNVTPSTHISCRIYGNTISIRGQITLWNSYDSRKLSDSISNGINSALETASSQGYDVYNLCEIDTSGLEISAVDTEN